MKQKIRKNFLPVLVALLGLLAGVAVVILDWWNWLEPATGMATLGVAAGSWLRSYLAERKFSAVMEQKSFQITLGLREGYLAGAPEHTFADAEKAYCEWMQQRVDEKLRIITGLLDTMTLTFPVRNGEGGFRVAQEPGVMLTGSLSPHYDKGRSDQEVTETLSDLAQHMGAALGQVRVYVSYCGRQWTVEVNK